MAYRNVPLVEAVDKLSKTRLTLDSKPWRNVLWDGKKVMTANQRLNRNLLLKLVGEPEESKDYSVLDAYRTAVNNPDAELSDVVRFGPVRHRKKVG